MARIPADAFDAYVAMGAARSLTALAERYGVTPRAVAKRAAKEGWKERLAAIEETARSRADAAMTESLEEVSIRHLKIVKLVQHKAVEALRSMPLATGSAAVRALEASIKLERLLYGQTSEMTSMAVFAGLTDEDMADIDRLARRAEEEREAALRRRIEKETRAQIAREAAEAEAAGSAQAQVDAAIEAATAKLGELLPITAPDARPSDN